MTPQVKKQLLHHKNQLLEKAKRVNDSDKMFLETTIAIIDQCLEGKLSNPNQLITVVEMIGQKIKA